ncbi:MULTISPECIES: hypothetical protein [unclassified Nostoc]|nr:MULTISPECIES: hypothetical protein [unclassified Nostoc]
MKLDIPAVLLSINTPEVYQEKLHNLRQLPITNKIIHFSKKLQT